MKKWVIIAAFSVLCTVIISLWKIDFTAENQVLYIKGGEPLLVDTVSTSDQFVFYEVNGRSGMFMKDDITSVGSITVEKDTSLILIIDQNKRRIMERLEFGKKLVHIADSRLLLFLVILATTVGITKVVSALWFSTKSESRKNQAPLSPGKPATTTGAIEEDVLETSDLRDIVLFFLELYKLQNGLTKDALARFKMTENTVSNKMTVFELGVKGSNDWMIRRMSIGPLGEDTGSKSKCFYVIYDTHMVVKIPPIPVTDIDKYIKDIRKEVQIASSLSPVACIVPRVSVVLKKVKKLPYENSLTAEQLEKQYIRLVEEKPEYQEYLKIGDRFAFFMELTNSFFIGRVIDELHESKDKTGEEIRKAPDVAWDQQGFTTRYGLESLPVFEGLQALYSRCEAEAKRISKDAGYAGQIHPFQIKNWFISSIAGEGIRRDKETIEETLLNRIEKGFSTIFKADQKSVDDLIGLLKKEIETKTFLKNRKQIENIIFNLLMLLCLLKEKRVALRDLKPDNLFLDADPGNYPVFLKNRGDFSIGVIDVETAGSLVPTQDGTIAQPLLGGTPLYATPLHLLKNQTIAAHFRDLAETLHFQDWFAAIAIIFKTITGRNLFPRAARSFPAILKTLKSGRSKTDPDETTVQSMNQQFWAAAVMDMKAHLSAYSEVLNQLILSVPEPMAPLITSELERESECIDKAIRRHVTLSPLLKSEKNHAFLLEASGEVILKQANRWERSDGLSEQHRKIAPQMVSFLNNLNRLKNGGLEKHRAIATFAPPPHEISAYALIEAMFQIAFQALYKSRWKSLPKQKKSDEQAAVTEDRSMVSTILNDN